MKNEKELNRKQLKKSNFIKRYFYPIMLFINFLGLRNKLGKLIDKIIFRLGIKKSHQIFFRYYEYANLFKKVFENSDEARQYNIVFPSMLGSNSNLTFINLMLADFAQERNFKPCILVCDGSVPICTKERIGKTRENNKLFCYECKKGYKHLSKETGINITYFSDYIKKPKIKDEIKDELDKINKLEAIEKCFNYKHNNIAIGMIARKSVLRFFLVGDFVHTNEELKIFKKFLFAGVLESIIIREFLNEHQDIKKSIFNNGTLIFENIFSQYCNLNRIDFVTYETFIGDNSLLFKKNDEVMNLLWLQEMESFYIKNTWNEEFRIKAIEHFDNISRGVNMYALLNSDHNPNLLQQQNNYVVLFTNLNFDTAVIDKNTIFSNMKSWILEVIDFWQKNEINIPLIVRIHPGEVKLKTASKEFIGDMIRSKISSDKIFLIDATDPINSYELIKDMKFALIYSSTIGLEIAHNEKTCVVAGNPFFKQFPFVITPQSKQEYFEEINRLLLNSNFRPDKEQLYKLVYYVYYIRNYRLIDINTRTRRGEDVFTNKNLIDLKTKNRDVFNNLLDELECK